MMQPLSYFAVTFLCSLSFLSSVLSIQCSDTQYAWPGERPQFCCDKCPPGRHFVKRLDKCNIQCEPCADMLYKDTYNMKMTCNICETCNRPNMEYKSHCTTTHNAECRCKAGYECKDYPCKQCLPMSTTKPTTRSQSVNVEPITAAVLTPGTRNTLKTPQKPFGDTVWFLVIIALLCTGIAFVVVTKIKPFLQWIRFKHGYLLAISHAAVPPCSPDEEVSKPVQEAGNLTNLKTDPELGL